MQPDISIRPYLPGDADATIDIFLRAIREVSAKDYSPAQINAWARVDDRQGWAERRASRPAWIAEAAGRAIGFTDLVPDGYLDMMFVHPEWQGLGVASRLLHRVEQAARALGLDRIHTEASITARPFFLRRGFRLIRNQVVEKRGERLDNFLMEKPLPSDALTADQL
jgi:putative acetyltransferase